MGRSLELLFLFPPGLTNEDRGCQDGKAEHYQQQEADK
jgi:hypothetical protein